MAPADSFDETLSFDFRGVMCSVKKGNRAFNRITLKPSTGKLCANNGSGVLILVNVKKTRVKFDFSNPRQPRLIIDDTRCLLLKQKTEQRDLFVEALADLCALDVSMYHNPAGPPLQARQRPRPPQHHHTPPKAAPPLPRAPASTRYQPQELLDAPDVDDPIICDSDEEADENSTFANAAGLMSGRLKKGKPAPPPESPPAAKRKRREVSPSAYYSGNTSTGSSTTQPHTTTTTTTTQPMTPERKKPSNPNAARHGLAAHGFFKTSGSGGGGGAPPRERGLKLYGTSSSGLHTYTRFTQDVRMGGFRNLGNTCYMNAIVAAMLAQPRFIREMISSTWADPIFKRMKTCTNTALAKDSTKSKPGVLSHAFLQIIGIFKGSKRRHAGIDMSDLKRVIEGATSYFEGNEQQDAHEFFSEMLNALHDDLENFAKLINKNLDRRFLEKQHQALVSPDAPTKDAPSNAPSFSAPPSVVAAKPRASGHAGSMEVDASCAPIPFLEPNGGGGGGGGGSGGGGAHEGGVKPKKPEEPPMGRWLPTTRCFHAEVEVSLACCKCHFTRAHCEQYRDFSLDIPANTAKGKPRLMGLLREFFDREEMLELTCEKCDSGYAIKRSRIKALPTVLVFHLKRFEPRKDNPALFRKTSTPVSVPIALNVRSFCVPHSSGPPPAHVGVLGATSKHFASVQTPALVVATPASSAHATVVTRDLGPEPVPKQPLRNMPSGFRSNVVGDEESFIRRGDLADAAAARRRKLNSRICDLTSEDSPRTAATSGGDGGSTSDAQEEAELNEAIRQSLLASGSSTADPWACPQCTLENTGSLIKCAGCGFLKAIDLSGPEESDGVEDLVAQGLKNTQAVQVDVAMAELDDAEDADPRNAQYTLTSVVHHMGSTAFAGHYVTHAFNAPDPSGRNGGWKLYNDSSVADVDEGRVLQDAERTGYLLFYHAVGC